MTKVFLTRLPWDEKLIISLELKLIYYNQASETIAVKLINKDTNFTEKIIKDKIVIKNLKYKINIELVDLIETVIKSKYISKYFNAELPIGTILSFEPLPKIRSIPSL